MSREKVGERWRGRPERSLLRGVAVQGAEAGGEWTSEKKPKTQEGSHSSLSQRHRQQASECRASAGHESVDMVI